MDTEKGITVNIINRNYYPNRGITGESAAELAGFLIAKGITVNVIHIDADYQVGAVRKSPIGNAFPIKTFYNGKNTLLRLAGSLYEGVALVRKSQLIKCDVTICMTEPPLLNVIAALLIPKKQKWILWSMDLFPEALAAGKVISRKNPLYKWMDRVVRRNKPKHVIALGDYQIGYLRKKFGDHMGFTMLPCGIYKEPSTPTSNDKPLWFDDKKTVHFGYCGNIGEAHSVKFLFSVIDGLKPTEHKMIISVYGSKAKSVLDYAVGKPGVEVVPFVGRKELSFIDVHLASLKEEWVNVCVPSKTVSSVCSGSAFLYYGKEESDNWGMFSGAGWIIPTEDKLSQKHISDLLEEIEASLAQKKSVSKKIAEDLYTIKERAFHHVYSTIVGLTSRA